MGNECILYYIYNNVFYNIFYNIIIKQIIIINYSRCPSSLAYTSTIIKHQTLQNKKEHHLGGVRGGGAPLGSRGVWMAAGPPTAKTKIASPCKSSCGRNELQDDSAKPQGAIL